MPPTAHNDEEIDEIYSLDDASDQDDDISSADEAAILAREPVPIDSSAGFSSEDAFADTGKSSVNPTWVRAAAPVSSAAGPGMAKLVGHLRCDNLKLQEALAERQHLLDSERAERHRLEQELALREDGKENLSDTLGGLASSEDKLELERELIHCKMKCADAIDRADTLEALKDHYEAQLAKLVPSFKPVSFAALEQDRVLKMTSHDSEICLEAVTQPNPTNQDVQRKGRRSITKVMGRMFRTRTHRVDSPSDLGGTAEDLATQREVISCLMAELEKANRKTQRLRAKLGKSGAKEP